MTFKIVIGDKGKAWKIELESDSLIGKSIGDKIQGTEVSPELSGYELEITGASDKSGFPHKPDEEGPQLRKVLLTKGWGMHKKPRKEGKKKVSTPKGLRLRKTVRGKEITDLTVQINMKVLKDGSKPLSESFPDQNKLPEPEPKPEAEPKVEGTPSQPEAPSEKPESPKEEIAEEIKEEVKEEIKEDIPKSPETDTEEKKEEAAEVVAEEVKEEIEPVIEKIAEKEEEKKE